MHLKIDHEGEKERKQKDTTNQKKKKEKKKSDGNILNFFLQKKAMLGMLLLFSCQVMSDAPLPHGLHHARLPCSSLSPRICSNSCPLSQWCHPPIPSYAIAFSSCLQSFPASGYFPMNWLFESGGQSIGVSASVSVLSMDIQSWFPLGLTGLISLLSKWFSRVFSSITIWKHPFFSAQPSWKNHS